ncbi:MAG: hypothetical protein ACAF41_11535 [Leptolyngbya sp. BL-A-14]
MATQQKSRHDRFHYWALGTLALCLTSTPGNAAPAPGSNGFFPDNSVFDYLNQKYTLELGDSRGACGYFIDPDDVYQYGSDRILMVKVSRGAIGTACGGVLQFRLLQVNCQSNTLRTLALQGGGMDATWQTDNLELYPTQPGVAAEGFTAQVAKKVCALPVIQGKPSKP